MSKDLKTLCGCIEDGDCIPSFDRLQVCSSEALPFCDCSSNSQAISSFCHMFKSKPAFTEQELDCFMDIILAKLNEELDKRPVHYDNSKCSKIKNAEFYIVPVIMRSDSQTSSESYEEEEYEICSCVTTITPTCSELKATKGECRDRESPIILRHHDGLLDISSALLSKQTRRSFNLDYVGKSDEIGKWGDFLTMVERVLFERDMRLIQLKARFGEAIETDSLEVSNSRTNIVCCVNVCTIMPRRRTFEDLERFHDIELFGFSTFCRGLMRWKNCTTKRWKCIIQHPHIVIHLPSMSYPRHLRCKANKRFQSLQSAQIGRLGWLVNQYCQVIYVCPGKSTYETVCILQNFIKTARPDVSLDRLWIIANRDDCFCDHIKEEYRSGCETLFYTPRVYRRVRYLTAGRRGFIIPGIQSKMDVFIACELKTSIVGPCLKFQERLLNKHYVMLLLAEANIQHPPFAGVRNFFDLCEVMAEMMVALPSNGPESKWLLKVNSGFCGYQNAHISLDPAECYKHKEQLSCYLYDVLPDKMKVNNRAYKDVKDFLYEMEIYGGILVACPSGKHSTVSLGCFIEHDMAKALLRTTADVIQKLCDCGSVDVGYIIPQTSLPNETLLELVDKLGEALTMEQYIGFFGVDIVIFEDKEKVLNYWVVDIDPYYTDLLSFDDWRRFCLNISETSCSTDTCPQELKNDSRKNNLCKVKERFIVCSGRIYANGLSLVSRDFFVDLFKKHKIAYSYKATTGCMVCPIDNEKRAYLLFALCSGRELALRYFVRALKALHSVSRIEEKKGNLACKNYLIDLARDMRRQFGIDD